MTHKQQSMISHMEAILMPNKNTGKQLIWMQPLPIIVSNLSESNNIIIIFNPNKYCFEEKH